MPDQLPLVLVASVALVDGDSRVLISERPPGKSMSGKWEFPGGKVEFGETPETALIRELQEELSIDTYESCVAPFTFVSYAYEKFHLLMPLYICRKWEGKLKPREGQNIRWVRPKRLGECDMLPADKQVIAMLRDYL